MAKFVIAGRSDCPLFARVEMLGDYLAKNLPSFHVHKIIQTPEEWRTWLFETCGEYGWSHEKSPLIWRELVDRGGKPSLIGGANEFQEYLKAYYNLESAMTTEEMSDIGMENFQAKEEMVADDAYYRELSKAIYVCITAAESPVCYSLVESLLSGEVFGSGAEVCLRLLVSDHHQMPVVQAVAMDLQDLCSRLLRGVQVLDIGLEAFNDCSIVVMLDELLRNDEDHVSWVWRNYDRFSVYGQYINHSAKRHCRVLVSGRGPVNFNTMVLINSAPNVNSLFHLSQISRHNIVGVSQEVESRAQAVIADRLKVNSNQVQDLVVWGNVNGRKVIDTKKAKVFGYKGAITGPPFYYEPAVQKLHDNQWLKKKFLPLADLRRRKVEEALGHEACASSARAVTSTLHHLLNGSAKERICSLAVSSEGWYKVPEGLVFSYPVDMTLRGQWTVVEDMQLTIQEEIELMDCAIDLIKEAEVVYPNFHDDIDVLQFEQEMLKCSETSTAEILCKSGCDEILCKVHVNTGQWISLALVHGDRYM
ncbi:putative malate dehydrogenase 1B [Babylonia areolata]|uniref:putative malate dehydrogenase 1B n=1 Tax=Babylonia areolata TaxID=304850 RepID=UPI003FCEFFD5